LEDSSASKNSSETLSNFMPVELQVIRASEFIRLDAHAHLDLAASKDALQSLAHACHKRGIDSALLDLRSLPVPPKPLFTPTELAALVRTFSEAGFSRQQRLAILYNLDVYGGVRNFAFISRLRGLRVQAFTDFETALQWLSEEQLTHPQSREGELPVPITKHLPEPTKVPVRLPARAAALDPIPTTRKTRREAEPHPRRSHSGGR
jgi:hypothetical protein